MEIVCVCVIKSVFLAPSIFTAEKHVRAVQHALGLLSSRCNRPSLTADSVGLLGPVPSSHQDQRAWRSSVCSQSCHKARVVVGVVVCDTRERKWRDVCFAARCTNITSPCLVCYFLIKPGQLGEPKTLGYIEGTVDSLCGLLPLCFSQLCCCICVPLA